MYEWRKMTGQQRREAMESRRARRYPWHGPPHLQFDRKTFLLSAACYEHKPHIGRSPDRMVSFEARLLKTIEDQCAKVMGWCVLPNHYHLLLETKDIQALAREIGRFHGRLSFEWNGEESTRGRKVWHRCTNRAMRSEGHFWSTMNYVHHNPVHHGYVKHWQDWPFSSAAAFLREVGKEKAKEIWRDYPLLDYGKGWDDPRL